MPICRQPIHRLAGDIRLLAGVEALTGLVLIAWTASFAFLQMQRFWTDA